MNKSLQNTPVCVRTVEGLDPRLLPRPLSFLKSSRALRSEHWKSAHGWSCDRRLSSLIDLQSDHVYKTGEGRILSMNWFFGEHTFALKHLQNTPSGRPNWLGRRARARSPPCDWRSLCRGGMWRCPRVPAKRRLTMKVYLGRGGKVAAVTNGII